MSVPTQGTKTRVTPRTLCSLHAVVWPQSSAPAHHEVRDALLMRWGRETRQCFARETGEALISRLSLPTWNVSPGSSWCTHYHTTLPEWWRGSTPHSGANRKHTTHFFTRNSWATEFPKVASQLSLEGRGQPDPMHSTQASTACSWPLLCVAGHIVCGI